LRGAQATKQSRTRCAALDSLALAMTADGIIQ
jgi:hypothetical protein